MGKSFFGPKFFPDFGAQIGQEQFFIFWQDGQTPHQLYFTNVNPNGRTGNQSIFGSKIEEEKNTVPGQIGNMVVQNFQHVC